MTASDDQGRSSILRPLALGVLVAGAAAAAVTLLASPTQAVPARPGPVVLHQPDGSTFRARLFGDEWYNGTETRGGFTVVQGPRGTWRYAVRAADGSLRGSAAVVGEDPPPARRHLRDADLVRSAERRRSAGPPVDVTIAPGVGGPVGAPALGAEKSLVILAQFLDQSSLGTTAAQWSSAYFGTGKTVADYYAKASRGQFGLTPAAESYGTANDGVVGWVTLAMNHPNRTQSDAVNRAATRAAIIAADPYVNYASYDTNGDGVVTNHELHITVIAAGQEASCCAHLGKALWGHRWWLMGAEIPVVDGRSVGGWGYTQFGEMHGSHMAALGIMAHEMGHDLELPDLYDADRPGPPTSDGVGTWSLMGYGSWLGLPTDAWGTGGGQTPPLPDAWSRWSKGWITPTRVTGTQTRSVDAAAGASAQVAVQLLDNPGGSTDWGFYDGAGTGEYFLVENRQPLAGTYDASLPGSGLLVLHVDESRDNNLADTARLVDVEEADGLGELDVYQGDQGDAGDLYPGSSGNRSFGATTNPNSNLISGAPSGVSITSIGNSATTMSATFTAPGGGGAVPPANDLFAAASPVSSRVYDDTVDTRAATIEQGEAAQSGCPLGRTAWYRYTPTRDVRVRADTAGSDFDTVLAVWRGESLGTLLAQGCNDDVVPGTTQTSQIPEFVAEAGQTYHFQVGGYYDQAAATVAAGVLQTHVRVRPVNDDFVNATTLTGAAGSVSGNNVNAGKEAGEPPHAGNPGGASVWWRWTAPTSGTVTMDTLGSAAADTLLGVYTGEAVGSTTLVAANDDITPGQELRSRVSFQAVAGTTYRIVVDGYGTAAANRGDLALGWSYAAASADMSVSDEVTTSDGRATYTIVVHNAGPSAAAATLVDTLSGKVDHVGTTTTAGSCSGAGPVTCNLGVVPSGGSVTVEVTADIAGTGIVTNTATVSSPVADPDTTNNTDTATFSVDEPELRDVVVDLVALDLPGREFGYRATVSRTGPADTAAVRVRISLPTAVELVSAPAGCTGWPRLDCTLGTVPPGYPTSLDVRVTPASPGPHSAHLLLLSSDEQPAGNADTVAAGVTTVCDNVPTSGNDAIAGTDADEVLCGLGGNDRIVANGGNDIVFGGSGVDLVSFRNSPGPMVVDLRRQGMQQAAAWPRGAAGSDGHDLMTGVEQVSGSSYSDQLRGSPARNRLLGLGGRDVIYGYGRGDVLHGGGGRDRLFGGGGADQLFGGRAVDRLDGGSRRDLCRDRRDVRLSCER